MRDFGYAKRGHDVNEAQAEVHAAFKEVRNRNEGGDTWAFFENEEAKAKGT